MNQFEHPSRNFSDGVPAGAINVTIYNQRTRETLTPTVGGTYSNGLMQTDINFHALNGDQIYLTLTDFVTGKLLYNSNVLATDQTNLQDYEISKDQFSSVPQADNEFKTY